MVRRLDVPRCDAMSHLQVPRLSHREAGVSRVIRLLRRRRKRRVADDGHPVDGSCHHRTDLYA